MKPISELLSLKGKTAVITGGAVNIGKAITLRLAEAGANVAVIFFQSGNDSQELSDKLKDLHAGHIMIKADLTHEAEVLRGFALIAEHFGNVDVLVNNAGIFGLSMQEDLKTKEWERVFDLNTRGLFYCSREAVKIMKNNTTGGVIVNLASINGLHPGFGQTAHYDASKGAVIAYTKSLALEVAKYGIRVNAVAPGLVDSENLRKHAADLASLVEKRTPLQKIATHQDISNAVLYLSTDISSHVTGEILVVDGGYLLT
ncbi:MAG: SDR family oxidoreductase [Bacteroidales bacterium]|nr:SDR family oxidoreductase [Bacteroidales bacterium]